MATRWDILPIHSHSLLNNTNTKLRLARLIRPCAYCTICPIVSPHHPNNNPTKMTSDFHIPRLPSELWRQVSSYLPSEKILWPNRKLNFTIGCQINETLPGRGRWIDKETNAFFYDYGENPFLEPPRSGPKKELGKYKETLDPDHIYIWHPPS